MNEQETAAAVMGAATMAEQLAELNERFEALVAKLKLSQETHDEERAVRLLAWKLEWDTMMRERDAAIAAHVRHTQASALQLDLTRVMIDTREADARSLQEHRANVEAIYRKGFDDIATSLSGLTVARNAGHEEGKDADEH